MDLPISILSVAKMNGGLLNSEAWFKLNQLESKTDSKEMRTQTEDSNMLKSLLKDKFAVPYQTTLQELVNGTQSNVSNQLLELTSRSETQETCAFISQLSKSPERESNQMEAEVSTSLCLTQRTTTLFLLNLMTLMEDKTLLMTCSLILRQLKRDSLLLPQLRMKHPINSQVKSRKFSQTWDLKKSTLLNSEKDGHSLVSKT